MWFDKYGLFSPSLNTFLGYIKFDLYSYVLLFFFAGRKLKSDYVTTSYINKMLTKVNYSFLYVVMHICNRIKICNRFNNKRKKNWLILYVLTGFFCVNTCILIARAKGLQVTVWSFVLMAIFMTCESISQWKWSCIFVHFVYLYIFILVHWC